MRPTSNLASCNLPGVLTVHLENIVTESSMCWNSMKQSNNKPRIAVIITSTNRRNRMNKLRAHMFGRSSSNIQGHTSTCHLHKLTACSLVFYVFFFIRYLVHQGFHNENGQSMQDMCVNVNLNSILIKCIFVQMAYCARLKNGMRAVKLCFASLVFHMTTLVFMYKPTYAPVILGNHIRPYMVQHVIYFHCLKYVNCSTEKHNSI